MEINFDKTNIMGILNVTPDSFSDGSNNYTLESLKLKVEKMILEGATIIDVGGESTRPGAHRVSLEEELNRVIPVIEMIANNFDVLISIDTYKSEVAKRAVEVGASIINDVRGNTYDGKMLDVVEEFDVYYIAMHNKEKGKSSIIKSIEEEFDRILTECSVKEINISKVILDPGIGFLKSKEDNLKILKGLSKLKQKYASQEFLIGVSRKGFIGKINNIEEPNKRVIGTCVISSLAVQASIKIIRVHDVLENVQAVEMMEAILRID